MWKINSKKIGVKYPLVDKDGNKVIIVSELPESAKALGKDFLGYVEIKDENGKVRIEARSYTANGINSINGRGNKFEIVGRYIDLDKFDINKAKEGDRFRFLGVPEYDFVLIGKSRKDGYYIIQRSDCAVFEVYEEYLQTKYVMCSCGLDIFSPMPLVEPIDNMWYIDHYLNVMSSSVLNKLVNKNLMQEIMCNYHFFKTKEDAEEWLKHYKDFLKLLD